MNINQLKYITAINKHKHFTRAAESCDIAQSTLSREVQKLELELGVMIFDRTRTPVVPTQKGKDLLEIANNILFKIKSFELAAKNSAPSKTEYFNLGIWSCIAPYILPKFLERFNQKYPNVNLNISELSIFEIQEDWTESTLDGCITPDIIQKPGFYESLLYEEEFVVYKNNMSKTKTASIRSLVHHDLKKVAKELLFNDKKNKVQNSFSYQKGSIETIRKIVECSGDLTILPKSYLTNSNESKNENLAKSSHPSKKIGINFVSPRIFEKKEIIKSIKKELKTLCMNIQK